MHTLVCRVGAAAPAPGRQLRARPPGDIRLALRLWTPSVLAISPSVSSALGAPGAELSGGTSEFSSPKLAGRNASHPGAVSVELPGQAEQDLPRASPPCPSETNYPELSSGLFPSALSISRWHCHGLSSSATQEHNAPLSRDSPHTHLSA